METVKASLGSPIVSLAMEMLKEAEVAPGSKITLPDGNASLPKSLGVIREFGEGLTTK